MTWHALLPLMFCGLAAHAEEQSQRPNILWISCEDISPDLGCYGNDNVSTPTLDRLAAEGVRFTQAFAVCPVCATNRSGMITGMYPTTLGTHFMRCRARLPSHVRCFSEYLRQAGYYTSNNVKTDYNFEPPASAWDESSGKAHWRGRRPGQPFFAVFNFTMTHESQVWPRAGEHWARTPDVTADQRIDPERVALPPYHCDTPETRRDRANYLENIVQLDHEAARLLEELEADGLADSTIVFFWSDHGMGLPRGKRWLYDSGTRIPLIVRVPERWRKARIGPPGSVSDELVSSLDLAPTALGLAGVEIPAHSQGQPFFGPGRTAPRQYVFGTRDRMDERYDMVRTVRDKRYRYIRNYMPWKPYAQYLNYGERNETMRALRRADRERTLPPGAAAFMSQRKPVEELYDTLEDPHEVNNLADSTDQTLREVLRRMRAALDAWSAETGDLGLVPESILVDVENRLGHRGAFFSEPGSAESLARVRRLIAPLDGAPADVASLFQAVGDEHPVVRYWGVLLLVDRIGIDPVDRPRTPDEPFTAKVRSVLAERLEDPSAAVRVAAAEGLCRNWQDPAALESLQAELTGGDPWTRLQAAIALDEMDEFARPATDALEKAMEDDNPYVVRVAERALQTLLNRAPRDISSGPAPRNRSKFQ